MKAIISSNIKRIRARIEDACVHAGRSSSELTLVGVTKYVTPEVAMLLPELGINDLGENRIPKLIEKHNALPASVVWHMIGNLQRNKARKAIEYSSLIHAVDSVKLIDAIGRISEEIQKPVSCLLEVNVSEEDSKHGFSSSSVDEGVLQALKYKNLVLKGLMTMAPFSDNPEDSRPYFSKLKSMLERLKKEHSLPESFCSLSMGMSGDFEVAIEEGATILRIGSLFFEGCL